MRVPLAAALIGVMVLGACSSPSRLNPMNWFSSSRSETVTLTPEGGYAAVVDNRELVGRVLELRVEQLPGGAIVRATGLAPTQGWWDAELVADDGAAAGDLAYRFVISAPREDRRVSTDASRRITAAVTLTDRQLQDIRRIIVRGQLDQQIVTRR
jgi:hypothetical protein